MLRKCLAGSEHAVSRGGRIRRGRKGLQRAGEAVEDSLKRVAVARLAENALQTLEVIGARAGVGATRVFSAHLPLQILIELARDRRQSHADRDVTGGGRDL